MSDIDEKEFLEDVLTNIRLKDRIKAVFTLSFLDRVSADAAVLAMLEMGRADDGFALEVLASLLVEHSGLAQALPVIHETFLSKILDNPELFTQMLGSENRRPFQVLFIRSASELQLEAAVPPLLDILTTSGDPLCLEAAIQSLGAIGDPVAVPHVAEYLYSADRTLISAAIASLGGIASSSAVKRLFERMGKNAFFDLAILDLFARMQTPESLEALNSALDSHYAHVRTCAKQKLTGIGAKAVPVLLANLKSDDPDFLVHTLNVLGGIRDPAAIPVIRKLIFNEPKDPNVRFAAYEALGMLPLEKGAFILAAGLEDPVENVRSAAAKAIDKNFEPVLAAGMKNLIRHRDQTAQTILATFVDAECAKVVDALASEPMFRQFGIPYLAQKAHPDTRRFFERYFKENNREDLAGKIRALLPADTGAVVRKKVFCVDDSKMVLNIFRSTLHGLGYDPVLHEFPAQALEAAKKDKPHMVLTDLNMPGMDGIELTRRIRQKYSAADLPVVMVTTQSESHDHKAALEAGVQRVIQKPFTKEDLKAVLDEFLPE